MDQSDIDDLKHEARREKRIRNALINHPHGNDPDCPGWDLCEECLEELDECECEE